MPVSSSPTQQQIRAPIQQIIEGRYIEREKLIALLKQEFGEGNFVVRLQLNRWILSIPKHLTEEQIDSCCPLERSNDDPDD